ncbi:oligodendrocyte transcription factor 1 [Boleophthalmus pectinirostris]|uniref:oligodendrocyte transcription factor 1 n=1 Tax=Boleophthalmus pectinirostris TaxID=150288 RepID=UPI00242B71BE|nr:oligodendrocyte transcription factor 1 [Boleophthalmus pectinirostris]
MNPHPGHPLPPRDLPSMPHCPPGFSLDPRLHHPPMVGLHRPPKPHRDLNPQEQLELRRKINSRERKRMQDLNVAMDALREVMVPYATNPTSQTPGRRLSKISTLVLARNYILLLGSSLQEMRRLLGEVSTVGVTSAPIPRLLLTGGCWPVVSNPAQILLTQEAFIAQSSSIASSNGKCPVVAPPSGQVEAMVVPGQWGSSGGSLCPCGVCRLPRFSHATSPTRFPK